MKHWNQDTFPAHICVCLGRVQNVFEVWIKSITGLQLPSDTVWGEADCFIQYQFPVVTQGVISCQHHSTVSPLFPQVVKCLWRFSILWLHSVLLTCCLIITEDTPCVSVVISTLVMCCLLFKTRIANYWLRCGPDSITLMLETSC